MPKCSNLKSWALKGYGFEGPEALHIQHRVQQTTHHATIFTLLSAGLLKLRGLVGPCLNPALTVFLTLRLTQIPCIIILQAPTGIITTHRVRVGFPEISNFFHFLNCWQSV